MCFSAKASFITASGLLLSSLANTRLVRNPQHRLFAHIPLLFSAQQFCEGIVWLTLQNYSNSTTLIQNFFVKTYLVMAFGIWPIYFPLSIYFCETNLKRKNIFFLIFLLGVVVSIILLSVLWSDTSQLQNYYGNLFYQCSSMPPFIQYPYLFAICGTALISSHRSINIFGALALIAFFISDAFYRTSFISVWCFFCAILSLIISWALGQLPNLYGQKNSS